MARSRNNTSGFVYFISALTVLILLFSVSVSLAMSIEEETRKGKEFLDGIKGFPTIDDTFIDQYLADLGNYIGQYQETKPFQLNFYIADDSQLNAFAAPAGHIFVYSGLINSMEQVDELASIVSHEIGHVSVRHLSRQMEKGSMISLGTLAGMLAGILVGGDAGEAVMLGSVAAGTQVMLSYSRDDEREADQLGFKKAYMAGFKPAAFINALARLQQAQLGARQIPAYLSTHPVDSERMSNLEVMSRQYPEPQTTAEVERFRRLYPLFRTIIKARSTEPRAAVRYFTSELEKSPDSSLAHFGLGMALQNKGEYKNAIEHFGIALNGLDEKSSVLRYMGETYQMEGQPLDAINTFEKALKINGRDKAVLSLLAASYQEVDDFSKAVEIYDRLSVMEPVKDDVFYNLGLCLGRQNNLALAHYNFGRYFKRTGDRDNADFHFKKAGELAGSDQALQEKIRKETEDMNKDNKAMKRPAS